MTSVSKNDALCGPWPWYAILPIGLSLTGFIPFMMMAWALYQRGRKLWALGVVLANLVVMGSLCTLLNGLHDPWWKIALGLHGINLLWTGISLFFQKQTLGRYRHDYGSEGFVVKVYPFLTGLFVGMAVCFLWTMPQTLDQRLMIHQGMDILDRAPIFHDFAQQALAGIPIGVFLGLWWAGLGRRFAVKHVLTFLGALTAMVMTSTLLEKLIIFICYQGEPEYSAIFMGPEWALIPAWTTGFKHDLLSIETWQIPQLFILALLCGAVSRLRDFWKRILVIPLVLIALLPLRAAETRWWQMVQGQKIYDLTDQDPVIRDKAYTWLARLLDRYDEHRMWPRLAVMLAQHYYERQQYAKANALYERIEKKINGVHRWWREALFAANARKIPVADQGKEPFLLDLPMVDYESYLTHNWMTLLSCLRYWEGTTQTDSDVKIKLKQISKSDDQILLNPLVSPCDIDAVAHPLGYATLVLPASLKTARKLIKARFPVIHIRTSVFSLLYGFDDVRHYFLAYEFDRLSHRLKAEDRKEAKEILAQAVEGQGQSQTRLLRIARQARIELPYDLWSADLLRLKGPFMVVIYPKERAPDLFAVLGTSAKVQKIQSRGRLFADIGFAFLQNADPVNAVVWAQKSLLLGEEPFPYYVIHLAYCQFNARHRKVGTRLSLENHLPELKAVIDFFASSSRTTLFEHARQVFLSDLEAGRIPEGIADMLILSLDPFIPTDRERIQTILVQHLAKDPDNKRKWEVLADIRTIGQDLEGIAAALEGVIGADPNDQQAKIRLAYTWILLNRPHRAAALMPFIQEEQMRFNPDYLFCKAAIAEARGADEEALALYEEAVSMRRYNPVYHRRQGRLLMMTGQKEKALKAIEWAARIDAREIDPAFAGAFRPSFGHGGNLRQ